MVRRFFWWPKMQQGVRNMYARVISISVQSTKREVLLSLEWSHNVSGTPLWGRHNTMRKYFITISHSGFYMKHRKIWCSGGASQPPYSGQPTKKSKQNPPSWIRHMLCPISHYWQHNVQSITKEGLAGLLQPSVVPHQKWQNVSMDFVTDFLLAAQATPG